MLGVQGDGGGVVTPLRDKAIDVVRAGMNRASEHDEEVVDVLLAAGMLTDPEEGDRLAAKAWRRARDVTYEKPLPPRGDEARIERAARADEAVDVVTRACREADPRFVAEGGSTRHWARDHFLPALRAEGYVVALAAADQEDTDA